MRMFFGSFNAVSYALDQECDFEITERFKKKWRCLKILRYNSRHNTREVSTPLGFKTAGDSFDVVTVFERSSGRTYAFQKSI